MFGELVAAVVELRRVRGSALDASAPHSSLGPALSGADERRMEDEDRLSGAEDRRVEDEDRLSGAEDRRAGAAGLSAADQRAGAVGGGVIPSSSGEDHSEAPPVCTIRPVLDAFASLLDDLGGDLGAGALGSLSERDAEAVGGPALEQEQSTNARAPSRKQGIMLSPEFPEMLYFRVCSIRSTVCRRHVLSLST